MEVIIGVDVVKKKRSVSVGSLIKATGKYFFFYYSKSVYMYLYVHNTTVAASCHTPSHTPSHTHTLKIYSLLINGWLVEPGCPVTTGSQQILQLQTPAVSHYFGFFPLHYFLGNSRVFNYYVCNK